MTLPAEFVTRMQALLENEYPAFEAALQDTSPVSIRINRKKTPFTPQGEPIPWCDSGYYIPERISFTFDPLFHAGTYYVQEASSMFLEQAIKYYLLPDKPVNCLDLCAAPGGKSTLLLNCLPAGSLLVSNEVVPNRSHVLAENLAKWGSPHQLVTRNETAKFALLPHLFDVVVADVPCSGEGMFRKDPESIGEWSPKNVETCVARQKRIVADAWTTLRPGGLMLYSTCTYNTEEDERMIQFIVDTWEAETLSIPFPEEWNISGSLIGHQQVYRFFPHKTRGEGFFFALLRKPDESFQPPRLPKNTSKTTEKTPQEVRSLLTNPETYLFQSTANGITAVPDRHQEILRYAQSQLTLLQAGIHIGIEKGKSFIPSASLALSTALQHDAFPAYTVSWEEAIRYLRCESLTLPEEMNKGYVLLYYSGHPIGFVKNIGNRANNLYPTEWRIRSPHLPDEGLCRLK